ncbi:polysaccharide deacetylase family protein [Cetobacterium somerae]|uniref:polysaccharide deacetylase family protein n=1 Tax=Cetobacterium somerae TaxID=188913 RepID=UPI00211E4743|nr:polysaccharide deacetylase family protein [Cetobacterium somerae]MCQ9627196.1 polysaccharide deacetylase family protein [Cetobacterium somerae]
MNNSRLLLLVSIFFVTFSKGFAKEKIFFQGNSNIKKIALTFDDGPNKTSLPKILDLLKSENIKASFFLIGKNIADKKLQVERIHNEGHLVLNHSYTHSNFDKASKKLMISEIEKTNNVINDILGVTPRLYRPPYGIITKDIKLAVKNLEMNIVLWNVDGEDWNSERSLDYVVNTQKKETKNGSIILMHTQPNKEMSYEALKILIPHYRTQGYEFVKLDELLGIEAYQQKDATR